MGLSRGSGCAGRSGWTCALAVLALAAAGSAGAQFRPLSGHEYREVMNPKHMVSGHLVVGLSLVDKQRATPLEDVQLSSRKISIYVAEGLKADEQIRVDLDSPDGRFHGTGVWQLEAPVDGGRWVELTLLQGKDPPQRPRLQGGHLAVSVRIIEPGKSAAPRLVLASLVPPDELAAHNDQRELWLQINARRAQMEVRGASGHKPLRCERVASASAVRFDTLCKIAVAQLEKGDGNHYKLTLLRRDGFAVQPYTVELGM